MQVLREIKPRILPIVTPDVGAKFDQLVDNYVYAAEQLRSLIYKLMCPSLINQNGQVFDKVTRLRWLKICLDLNSNCGNTVGFEKASRAAA